MFRGLVLILGVFYSALGLLLSDVAYGASNSKSGLSICVQDVPDPVSCTKTVTYYITVKNGSSSEATDVKLYFEWMDRNTTFVSATPLTGNGWYCSGSVWSRRVECKTYAGMKPGRTDKIKIVLQVGGPNSRNLATYASFSATINCSCKVSTGVWENTRVCCSGSGGGGGTVEACKNFTASVTATKSQVNVGDLVEFRVEIDKSNNYSATGRYVSFDVYWSGNLTYKDSYSGFSCSNYGNHLHCCRKDYDWGGSYTYLRFLANSPGEAKVEVKNFKVEGGACDSGTLCPEISATKSIDILSLSDVKVTALDSPDPVSPGGYLTYEVSVENDGPGTARNVWLSSTLNALRSFEYSLDGRYWSPWVGKLQIGDMASGSRKLIYIRGIVPEDYSGRSITNTFKVSTETNERNLGNNQTSVVTSVVPSETDLSISISADKESVCCSGVPINYTVVLKNLSSVRAEDVLMEVVYPRYLKVKNIQHPPGWVCSTGSGKLSCRISAFDGGLERQFHLTAVVKGDFSGDILTVASVSTVTKEQNLLNNRSESLVKGVLFVIPVSGTGGSFPRGIRAFIKKSFHKYKLVY
jgi:hypothetical protein